MNSVLSACPLANLNQDQPLGFEDSTFNEIETQEILECALFSLKTRRQQLGDYLDINNTYLDSLQEKIQKALGE